MSGLTTKPSEILGQRVEPAYSEHLNEPLSERRANTLAGALNDHLEWTYKYYQQLGHSRLNGVTLRAYRTDLFTQHRPLRVMSDLADAARHRELDRAHDPPRVVRLSTDAYYEKEGVLFVKGFDTPFSSEAGQAVEFWRKYPD